MRNEWQSGLRNGLRSGLRKRLAGLILAAAGVLAVPATVGAAGSLSVNMSVGTDDPAKALILGAAAAFFGLDTTLVAQYTQETGSTSEAVSVIVTSGETQSPPETIIVERNQSGWDGVMQKYQVACKRPPGKAKGWSKNHSCDARSYTGDTTVWFLSQYYDVSPDLIVVWHEHGLSYDDAALVLNLAAIKHVTTQTVVDLRLRGESWTLISAHYGVPLSTIEKPVPPKHHYDKPIKHGDDHGHENGHGHGKH